MIARHGILALGTGAILLIAVHVWLTGVDSIGASVATAVIGAVVIVYVVWRRPTAVMAVGIIIIAAALGLLIK